MHVFQILKMQIKWCRYSKKYELLKINLIFGHFRKLYDYLHLLNIVVFSQDCIARLTLTKITN